MPAFPLTFYLACLVTAGLIWEALHHWREPWTKPAMAVYLTGATWYLGNFLYSGAEHFATMFPREIINAALLEYVLFCVGYRLLVGWLNTESLSKIPEPTNDVTGFSPEYLERILFVLIQVWAVLFVIGLWQTGWYVLAVVCPPLAGWKANLFPQEALGCGLSFLRATAGYIYSLICSAFGVFLVLCHGRLRWIATGMMALTWPYYLFDRTRHIMLAIVMPAVIAYLLLSKSHPMRKFVVAVCIAVAVNFWFLLVMQFRSNQEMSAFLDVKGLKQSDTRHLGLDMLEELCFINYFLETGEYKANYGRRYFAEIATVVPRTIWPGKPKIGWDYAIARGASIGRSEDLGMNATIATGMIGQGVVNFGRFFGVLSSALLMTLWTAALTRLWCQRDQLPRALLFLVGAGLTFNMGRDITLLVVWSFVFGYIGVRVWEWKLGGERVPVGVLSRQRLMPEPRPVPGARPSGTRLPRRRPRLARCVSRPPKPKQKRQFGRPYQIPSPRT